MKAFLAAAFTASLFGQALCLSSPLCDSVGSTWTSSSPRLSGKFPYYQMLFFCTGNLNLEGSGVDACVNNGQDCGLPAADAFCQYAGFDGAIEEQITLVEATEPVRAVTGEWCLSPGVYSSQEATSVARLAPSPGPAASAVAPSPFCQRIDALACYRKRGTLASALSALRARLASPAPAPASAAQPVEAPTAAVAQAPAAALLAVTRPLPAAGAIVRPLEVGGRRHLRL